MGRERKEKAFLLCVLLVGLVSQNVMITMVMSRSLEGLGDQKNYYSPDPHVGSTPKHSHKTPSCTTPTPSHGGGSYGTPTTPSHGSGGYYNPPSGGGGHSSPPFIITPPSSPVVDPVTPPIPTVPVISPTPTTPVISTPPSPLIPDPNSPTFPGTCNYWYTHPAAIWAIFGYWGTVGQIFGVALSSAHGRNLSLQEALGNPGKDGISALYREGTASLLNSMVNKKFVFTTDQVKNGFMAAIASEKSAAAQAAVFKKANEGHLKH